MSRTAGLPRTFTQRMKDWLGNEFDAFLDALQQKPPVSIRLNPRKGEGLFAEAEPVPWCSFGKYLAERPSFVWDPLYHAGAYYAQEASSMLFSNFISFEPGMRVLDLCAAPGGKSSLLLSFMQDESLLISNEMVGKRASILYENLAKWGDARSVVTNNRASDFLPWQGYFDVVLIDAPCSGEGMFRKDPGAVEQWSEGLVQQCSAVQKEILEVAVELVAEEGLLIYSTCTFEPAENENNLQWLYKNYGRDLEPVVLKFDPDWGLLPVEINTGTGRTQLGYYCLPHRVKGEGLFISAMRVSRNRRSRISGSRNTVRKASKPELDAVKHFVDQRDNEIYAFDNRLYAFPQALEADMTAAAKLRIKKLGTELGELNRGIFIPSHEMAMANLIHDNVTKAELSLNQALDYMQRKPVELSEELPKGWMIFTFEGRNLGWAKNLGNRINNHYPSEWRIRKEPDFY